MRRDLTRESAALALLLALWAGTRPWISGEALDVTTRGGRALGFLLLVSWLCGRLLGRLGLPRISGYMVAGVVAGPYLLALLGSDVAEGLRVFDNLALCFIAFTAGGEMRLPMLRRRAPTFAALGWRLVAVTFPAGFLASLLLRPFLPFLSALDLPAALSACLMLGLVVMSLSPAITIAVLVESRSRGPLSEIYLGVSVLLDLVIIVMFALLMSLSRWIALPGEAEQRSVLVTIAWEIVGSILAGLLFGWGIIGYLRLVGAELAIFFLGAAYLFMEVCDLLHLHGLLGAMVAGFMIENLTPHGEPLVQAVERASLPVYVLFFALAGAAIDLRALADMAVPALALVGVRAAAQWLAVRWAAPRADRPDLLRGPAFWGFLPQSGVSLGLVVLIARAFPQWGAAFATLAVAFIGVHQLAGPVLLRWLLERAGEVPAEEAGAAAAPGAAAPAEEARAAPT